MGTGVSPSVFDPDVEFGATLLPCARRENLLHCGGGCVLLDWAPVSGSAPTGGAGATGGPDPTDRWRERRRREDAAVRPTEPERAARRRRFDDPGVGPSHAPPATARADFEDIRCRLEMVLQEVPEGIWSHIQDEAFLEQCVGVSPPWRAIVRRAAVATALTTRRLSPGHEGPVGGTTTS
jgi:hypothetical protein